MAAEVIRKEDMAQSSINRSTSDDHHGSISLEQLNRLSREHLITLVKQVASQPAGQAYVADALRSVDERRQHTDAVDDGEDQHQHHQQQHHHHHKHHHHKHHREYHGDPSKLSRRRKKKLANPRDFDFDRHGTRHIALQLSYDGDRYCGFASQNEGGETVEEELIYALMRTKLIKDREWACYSRCGRTDKGVSALRQIVGLRIRSSIVKPSPSLAAAEAEALSASTNGVAAEAMDVVGDDEGEEEEGIEGGASQQQQQVLGDIWATPFETTTEGEIDYCGMLNRVLPPDIRAVGWAPAPLGFTARFCAAHRTYRYFFDGTGLNLEKMDEAAKKLEGDHDFRNFCKMDPVGCQSFRRVIHHARIHRVAQWQWAVDTVGKQLPADTSNKDSMVCCLEIQGQAFLWHMVRCIMAILFMIGRNSEAPSAIDFLLDIKTCPAKPQYTPSIETPLVLHSCGFRRLNFHFRASVLYKLWAELHASWADAAIKVARISNHIEYIASRMVAKKDLGEFMKEEMVRVNERKRKREGSSNGNGATAVEEEEEVGKEGEEEEGGVIAMLLEEGKEEIEWREALSILGARGLTPHVDDTKVLGHIPLMERGVGRSYEQVVAEMGEKKKALYAQAREKRDVAENAGRTQPYLQQLRG